MQVRAILALGISSCIAAFLMATDANAALIDFRMASFTGGDPDGATSAELVVDGVAWTISPNPEGAILDYDTDDGFEVEYDEIEAGEWLEISFSGEELFVEQIHLTDIEDGHLDEGYFTLESVDGSVTHHFFADVDQVPGETNGEKWIEVNAWVIGISFSAPELVGDQGHEYEFAVSGLSVSPVPEPSSAALFGLGSLLVGYATRKRRLSG